MDWTAITVAAISTFPGVLVGLVTLYRLTHQVKPEIMAVKSELSAVKEEINGRMDELIQTTAREAHAKGAKAVRDIQRAEEETLHELRMKPSSHK